MIRRLSTWLWCVLLSSSSSSTDGAGARQYLFYDGHPGYDFVTTDQNPDGSLCGKPGCNKSGQTPVLAAAAGTVACIDGESPCTTGLGEVRIDHGNGILPDTSDRPPEF